MNNFKTIPYIFTNGICRWFFVKKKRVVFIRCLFMVILIFHILQWERVVQAETKAPKETEIYAKSAVLLDGDSGRVLYGKNGELQMPMASTTKIMTLIIILENAELDDVVLVSDNAARQPKVHLGMHKGQEFVLKDLCYSLMLESHNDSAVALAEHVAGSVEGFASLMNEKARDIGCNNTYFITPNGLDARVMCNGTEKIHSTTAKDLAKIMRYCIKISECREQFLEITRTSSYSFMDVAGDNSYFCNNHNAFLQMMEGALTGKTGFTNKAGYCYVGALEREGRTYIVTLLACGWPNNKTYKWQDTKKLMTYGVENYQYREVFEKKQDFEEISIDKGCLWLEEADIWRKAKIKPYMKDSSLKLLLKPEEQVEVKYKIKEDLKAPIEENEVIGTAEYYLGGEKIKIYNIYSDNKIVIFDIGVCLRKIVDLYFL